MMFSKSNKNSKQTCIDILKQGKVVIIPTDTVYGFSAVVSDSFDCDERIRKIKGRAETKPFIQLIAAPQDIFKYTSDKIPQQLLNYWPGPLTIIATDNRLSNSKINTTAFRCPGDKWLRDVIKGCGFPIYSTSVNRSGNPVLETENEIIQEFDSEVDLIVLDGDKKSALPSTIVKVEEGKVVVLRQGAVEIKA